MLPSPFFSLRNYSFFWAFGYDDLGIGQGLNREFLNNLYRVFFYGFLKFGKVVFYALGEMWKSKNLITWDCLCLLGVKALGNQHAHVFSDFLAHLNYKYN